MPSKPITEIIEADSYKEFKVGDKVRGPGGARGEIMRIWRPAPRGQWRLWVFWKVRSSSQKIVDSGFNVLLADGHSVYPSMVQKSVR
jgi:prepilin-type processing-associated H-X9-DG protein